MNADWIAEWALKTIILIDRSEPGFKSHIEGKIRITLKNNKNFDIFLTFWLNQTQNCFCQIKKMKDEIFRFQFKKITSTEC